jgi:hypothetical protein
MMGRNENGPGRVRTDDLFHAISLSGLKSPTVNDADRHGGAVFMQVRRIFPALHLYLSDTERTHPRR